MPTRLRKLIGGVAILAFIPFYAGLMTMVGAHLPDQWAIKLIFFMVAGTAWGAPLLPLITWMSRGNSSDEI